MADIKKKKEKIPGMADWIKAMEKRKLEKKAYIGEENYAGKTMGTESGVAKKYKDDPYRTTKTVAEVEGANHALNLATDVGAAGLATAGGFKPLIKAVKEHGFTKGLKSIGSNPAFKEDLKKALKAQKYILPVGAGITAAYVGKAFHDDLKHKKMRSLQQHDNGPEFSQWHNQGRPNEKTASTAVPHSKELNVFIRALLADKRPDSKYDANQLRMGIKVEHEHTQSSFIAKKITKDHLDEIPDYYTRLKQLEDAAKLQKEAGLKDMAKAVSGGIGKANLKANMAYGKLHNHIDSMIEHKITNPMAKRMFEKSKAHLASVDIKSKNYGKKLAKSEKYYKLGAKIEGLGNNGAIDQISHAYSLIAEPLTQAKIALLNMSGMG